ncbi:unnamed protein product [Diatraea saccharalis]|uniref:Uncharacterized protein n=1 Tax=Diatraea saccharalis TaxID=40085 RepID=A0A9N9R1Z9_9NEOP|nr:unnamed protein product [Diatraea saccharalis]
MYVASYAKQWNDGHKKSQQNKKLTSVHRLKSVTLTMPKETPLVLLICGADIPVTPPAPPMVYCGELPDQIHDCLKTPALVDNEITSKCVGKSNRCDTYTCVFREAGWLVDGTVDKKKLVQHFDQYGVDHPAWAEVARQFKATCLERDLPAQGLYLNCPAYDIMWCVLTASIRSAQPSQWAATEACTYPRQYAAACPFCPSECFASAIPSGSCNACISLPRTT